SSWDLGADARLTIAAWRERLVRALAAHGLEAVPSEAPFVLAHAGSRAEGIVRALAHRRIAVRWCASFGLPEHLRVAVRPPGEQAAQAEAAGVTPRAAMNPILLKPEGDERSQLVVLGRARGTVHARDHWTRRNELWPVIAAALRELRAEFEVIVIEGAGSPAEVNLRAS